MPKKLLHYDVVFAGAGCAGLSLALRILQSPALASLNILLIDQQSKQENDHTWCFWETQPGFFESIVYHRWEKAKIYTHHHQLNLSFHPFAYKMIRSVDFYRFAHDRLQHAQSQHPHRKIGWLYEPVLNIEHQQTHAIVHTTSHHIQASYVFNSLPPAFPANSYKHFLWQHFRGWFVHMHKPTFDPKSIILMDFRVPQQNATAFMYVLPTSSQDALLEYTVFSTHLLVAEAYNTCIYNYMQQHYPNITYDIIEEEQGKIPMTDFNFPSQHGPIIYLGTAGGQTKASTGYTFSFIQQHSDALIRAWEKTGKPQLSPTLHQRIYRWYDQLLLHVLQHQLYPGDQLFKILFEKNAPASVLRFLNNQSSWVEDLHIIASLPAKPFLKAFFAQL
ncbi:MAG: hypothetical protein K6T34_03170 [Thermoflavifilum sp.]|nr:hypothetical protein [Thermoflavifilum sp.]